MAQARQKTTTTVKGAKLTVYKMGKRWRWMLMRDKKIVNSGSTESQSSAIRDGKAAAGVGKKPKKATKRKATRRKTAARRPTKKRAARKATATSPKRRGSSQKKTITIGNAKLTVYKMGKRWRWMLMRNKKIVKSGSADSRAAAERAGRVVAGGGKLTKAAAARTVAKAHTRTPRRGVSRNGMRAAGKAAAAETVAKLGQTALGAGVAGNGHRGRGRRAAAKPLDKGQREKQARSALSAALRRDK